MITTLAPPMTLAEFFAYEDDSDTLYELENGELVAMPPESELNRRIATFLFAYFCQLGLLPSLLTMKTEVVVSGGRATVRIPDLIVLSEALDAMLQGATRSTITTDMPPPRLVVEVVSPGKRNIDRDYRYKRSQYQAREINEYWIIDPISQQVTILTLVEGLYEAAVFTGEATIVSALLTELEPATPLTANQLLQAGI